MDECDNRVGSVSLIKWSWISLLQQVHAGILCYIKLYASIVNDVIQLISSVGNPHQAILTSLTDRIVVGSLNKS